MKATGIIFSNIYDGSMGELTKKRATAALPFGGRYRLIDFTLSNLANSGIISVGVLTKYNYRSLLDHLGSGSAWDLNRKNGGLFILPPFTSGELTQPRGKFEAMYNAIPFLNRINTDYVILCDASVVCRIDFEKVVEEHILSGADVTAVVNRESNKYKFDEHDVAFETENGKVTEISVGHLSKKENLVSMGIYVIERKTITDAVEDFVSKGRYSFERDYLQSGFLNNHLKLNIFEFEGTVLRNKDIETYFKNNLRLMENKIRKEFFSLEYPVFTKVRYEVPTTYGKNTKVNDCFIADGCKIFGDLENSVIFRDVVVEQGARIKNCVVMQGAKIEEGVEIENAIVEKNTVIGKNEIFKGAMNSPVIVR